MDGQGESEICHCQTEGALPVAIEHIGFLVSSGKKNKFDKFFGCCTADSQTDAGRHQLYDNGSLVLFSTACFWVSSLLPCPSLPTSLHPSCVSPPRHFYVLTMRMSLEYFHASENRLRCRKRVLPTKSFRLESRYQLARERQRSLL